MLFTALALCAPTRITMLTRMTMKMAMTVMNRMITTKKGIKVEGRTLPVMVRAKGGP